MTDFAKELMAAVMTARQNQPRIGGSASGGRAPSLPSTNITTQNQMGAQVDVGGIMNLMDRFGLIPKSRQEKRALGEGLVQYSQGLPEDQRQTYIKDPASQAMLKAGYDNGARGIVLGQDGTYDIPTNISQTTMPQEARGFAQTFGGKAPGPEHFASGMMGSPMMSNYRGTAEVARGKNVFDVVPSEAIQQQYGAITGEKEADAAWKRQEAASKAALTGPTANKLNAEAAYYNTGKSTPQDKINEMELKAQIDEQHAAYKTLQESNKQWLVAMKSPTATSAMKAEHTVAHNTIALQSFHTAMKGGVPGSVAYGMGAAQAILDSAVSVANTPRSMYRSSSLMGMGPESTSDTWNSTFKSINSNLDEFGTLINQHIKPEQRRHLDIRRIDTQLKLIDKIDVKTDVEHVELAKQLINLGMQADKWGLKDQIRSRFREIAKRKNWSDKYLYNIEQMMLKEKGQ